MDYFLGIDNGGTVTKACLYDEFGQEISKFSAETKTYSPAIGFVERDMEEMWVANCTAVRECIRLSGVDASQISCVAVCGHGKGLYLWGEEGPVMDGILSADNRAWKYVDKWEKDGTAEKLFPITFQSILPCQPVSLLAWIKENRPGVLEKVRYIFECKDYIRFRLTGQAFGEISDYSGTNMMNLRTGEYSREALKILGLEMCLDKLPPLKKAFEICGYITKETSELTGLAEGTPVAGGAFDINSCAIAAGVLDPDMICMIAGTWSINEYISRDPVLDGSVKMNSLFCLPDFYLVEESSATSCGNMEWFIKTLLPELQEKTERSGRSIYNIIDSCVEAVAVSELCPIFLPFLMASNARPNAMGSFVGINNYHTRAHMFRGIYEGICFSHLYHLQKLLASRKDAVTEIRLAGGASKSPVWSQMFADVMGIPVRTVLTNETGTLGCAVLGAVAAGKYKDIYEAASRMVRLSEQILPNPERTAVYAEKYHLYLKTIESLDGLWDSFSNYIYAH